LLTRPTRALVDDLAALEGDILVLGVGGKMGPTLARLAKRAAAGKRIVGVARFSEPGLQARLEQFDIETIACDLLDPDAVADLPRLPNVIFMAGRKFGTSGQQELTWAMNVLVPAIVAETFRDARIVRASSVSLDFSAGWFSVSCTEPPNEYKIVNALRKLSLSEPRLSPTAGPCTSLMCRPPKRTFSQVSGNCPTASHRS
jgi:hypothetical protein